eukprot:186821_1
MPIKSLCNEFLICLAINTLVWFIFCGSYYVGFRCIFTTYNKPRKFNPAYTPCNLLMKEIWRSWCNGIIICSMYETIIYHYHIVDVDTFSWMDMYKMVENGNIFAPITSFYKYGICFRTLIIIIIEDFEFYWYHRLCHNIQWLFRNVHKMHHESYNPNVFSGISFHWIEGILYFLPFFMFIFIEVESVVFSFFKFGLILGPIPNHTGYGNKNENKLNWCILMFRKGSYYHYIHHATNKYNFGSGLTPFWDKLMQTEYKLTPKQHFEKISKLKSS